MMTMCLVLTVTVMVVVSSGCVGGAAVNEPKKSLLVEDLPTADDFKSSRPLSLPEPLRLLGQVCDTHLVLIPTRTAEKIGELMARGKEVKVDELPSEVRELVADVEALCELDSNSTSREGRGLLSKLSFLTGLHFGSLFHGSGTVAATQSLSLLGRIINSALSVSYGPSGGVVPSVVPAVPAADSVHNGGAPPDEEDEEGNGGGDDPRIGDFLNDHNRRVQEFNRRQNLTTPAATYRQGRI